MLSFPTYTRHDGVSLFLIFMIYCYPPRLMGQKVFFLIIKCCNILQMWESSPLHKYFPLAKAVSYGRMLLQKLLDVQSTIRPTVILYLTYLQYPSVLFQKLIWFLIHICVLDCRVTEFNSVRTNNHWTKSDSVDRSETGCIYSICQAGYVHSLAKSNAYINNSAMYNLNTHPKAFSENIS